MSDERGEHHRGEGPHPGGVDGDDGRLLLGDYGGRVGLGFRSGLGHGYRLGRGYQPGRLAPGVIYARRSMPSTIAFERLCELLGASVSDASATKLFKAAQAKVGADYVVAKAHG